MLAFGDRVREARQRIRTPSGGRLTQGDLASAVGVERNTVSRWENSGVRPKDPHVVRRLAEVLQVPMEWLFADDAAGVGSAPGLDSFGGPSGDSGAGYGRPTPPAGVGVYRDRAVRVPSATEEVLSYRVPPRAYERVHGYVERIEQAGGSAAQIEAAGRILLDAATTRLRGRVARERPIEDVVADIDAAWRYIATVLRAEGREV